MGRVWAIFALVWKGRADPPWGNKESSEVDILREIGRAALWSSVPNCVNHSEQSVALPAIMIIKPFRLSIHCNCHRTVTGKKSEKEPHIATNIIADFIDCPGSKAS